MAGLLLSFNSGTIIQTSKGKVILPSRHYKTEASRHGMFLFKCFTLTFLTTLASALRLLLVFSE